MAAPVAASVTSPATAPVAVLVLAPVAVPVAALMMVALVAAPLAPPSPATAENGLETAAKSRQVVGGSAVALAPLSPPPPPTLTLTVMIRAMRTVSFEDVKRRRGPGGATVAAPLRRRLPRVRSLMVNRYKVNLSYQSLWLASHECIKVSFTHER